MPRIKLIVIEGDLTIEDTARLALALGNGATPALPPTVKGVEATLRTPEPANKYTPLADYRGAVIVPAVAVTTPAPSGAPPATSPAPVPTSAEVIQQTLSLDKPEPAASPAPEPAQAATSPLAGARKLRDVLEALREQGMTTPEALVAECQRLRADVPILARIAADQIGERVRRTLEGMA